MAAELVADADIIIQKNLDALPDIAAATRQLAGRERFDTAVNAALQVITECSSPPEQASTEAASVDLGSP